MGCGCGKKTKPDVVQPDKSADAVQSTLDTKATASLQEEIIDELDVPDPEAEKALAVLKPDNLEDRSENPQ